MKRGNTDADTCRLNGWEVGARLVGVDGKTATVIVITAIGEEKILARDVGDECERLWTLAHRDWRREGEAGKASEAGEAS